MSQTDERPRTAARRRGRPVGSDSVETRNRILRAARHVINERGYPAATFQAIAVQADLSRPTLHYYFSSRDEIYDVLMAESAHLVDDCVATARQCDTLGESLAALAEAIHDPGHHDRSAVAFLVSSRLEASRNPDLGDERTDALRRHLATLVSDAVGRGELPADTAVGPLADMLHSVLWGVGLWSGRPHGEASARSVTKQLAELFRHGLLATERSATPARDTYRDTPSAVGGRP
ncbi:TetR/AcrR family transcriptional regulator [Mycolicibacterium grossiae]|uniref:HTH tetR-type domain-containing protein n=1 Tax=Mycolicibacterium grossiae TaxID=1552759 RepID=A0A1E8PYX3_9MYCO|nr:TetR/AcrR family transcriptional regulator [Mycolicibacterium grossiae]OFJ51483.1 hypothetical protein BEL07_22620 [Mycolicibacterium grossiae]QEM46530.1 TetR/AcrR family transcriptional regulator [Mycolicibacterium grossiae]